MMLIFFKNILIYNKQFFFITSAWIPAKATTNTRNISSILPWPTFVLFSVKCKVISYLFSVVSNSFTCQERRLGSFLTEKAITLESQKTSNSQSIEDLFEVRLDAEQVILGFQANIDFLKNETIGTVIATCANIHLNTVYYTKRVCTIQTNFKVNIWFDHHCSLT